MNEHYFISELYFYGTLRYVILIYIKDHTLIDLWQPEFGLLPVFFPLLRLLFHNLITSHRQDVMEMRNNIDCIEAN